MSFGMRFSDQPKPQEPTTRNPLLNERREASLRVEYRAVNTSGYGRVTCGPWRATKAAAINDITAGGGLQARIVSMPEHLAYNHATKEFGDLK